MTEGGNNLRTDNEEMLSFNRANSLVVSEEEINHLSATGASTKSGFMSNLEKFRCNPWFRLFVYCLACLTTSCLYFGWQAYSILVIRSGAYAWECGPGSTPTTDPDDPALCLQQSKSVSRLYAIANGSEFACAAIAGVMLDTIGPKFTASTGELLQLLSILLLILSNSSFKGYSFAMFLSGACVNIICFPALTVMEQWPRHQAFAVGVIVGCQSAASVVAPILKSISDRNHQYSFRGVWGIYLLVVWLPVSLIYVWALPKSRDYTALLATSIVAVPAEAEGSLRAAHSGALILEEEDTAAHLIDDDENINKKTSGKAQWKLFLKSLCTIDVWVMAIFCGCLMFQFAYYPAVVKDAISMSMSDLIGWLTPLQGPFSFVIGFIMDYTGTTMIMAIMGLSLIFVNLSCAWGPDVIGLQKVVAVWFIFVQSATYNVKYTFVNEMYDPFNFGKLVGVLGIAGGIGVYCSNPLVERTEYATIFNVLTGIAGVMICITAFIMIRQKNGVTHKTVTAIDQANRHVNNV